MWGAAIIAIAASIWTGGASMGWWAASMTTTQIFAVAVTAAFVSGSIATQSWKGGLQAAFGAALTFGIGMSGMDFWGQVAAQAVTGGIMESLQGGNFGNGFLAAGLTAAVMPNLRGINNGVARSVAGALIGGTISAATGGKFANGAVSGAIQAAMMGAPDSEAYGAGGGRSSNSATALASEKAVIVEQMYSRSGQAFEEFEVDVHNRLQALTQVNGDEHAAGFSYRDVAGEGGLITRSYAAVIQTSGSPVISASSTYCKQVDGPICPERACIRMASSCLVRRCRN